MSQLTTYSGIDVNCTLQDAAYGTIQFGGVSQTGLASITVRMTLDHATIQGGMDGAAVPSYIPGEWGEIDIELWQTSTTQQDFVEAYNQLLVAARAADVSNQFSGTLLIVQSTTGDTHTCNGVAFTKVPDKSYAEQAGRVRWSLKACDIVSE
jgi:hypothetical protein